MAVGSVFPLPCATRKISRCCACPALLGHEHVDRTTIVRSCALRANDGNATREYIVTRGVEWCSGSNYNVGDVFDAGLGGGDAWCPILPGGISDERGAHLCEEVCSNASACAGFTLYPNASGLSGGAQCCFRESLTSMPRNESSPAVCYAKAGGPSVSSHCIEDGGSQPPAPLHLLFTGPSLTEGYPPSDSAIACGLSMQSRGSSQMVTPSGSISAPPTRLALLYLIMSMVSVAPFRCRT